MSELVKSNIDGTFQGWSGDTVFKLVNGQLWEQINYSYLYHYAYQPETKIKSLNRGYVMEVEGVRESIQVRPVYDFVESKIDGEFTGWNGETIFKLMNGQIWQQSLYAYYYHYAYMPQVLIYSSVSGGWKLKVEGINQTISVRKNR